MIISFLGDSITEGAGASVHENCFINLLRKKFPDIEIINYGISGTRIARQDEVDGNKLVPDNVVALYNVDFNSRVHILNRNSNHIFVFGGTNDFGHGSAPLGTMFDKDEYTFCGAFRTLLKSLIEKFKKENITVILPLPRFDEDSLFGGNYDRKPKGGEPLVKYLDAMIKLCDEYDVRFLDFRNEFKKPSNNHNEGLYFDGLHPNDKGHELLANLLSVRIEEIIK